MSAPPSAGLAHALQTSSELRHTQLATLTDVAQGGQSHHIRRSSPYAAPTSVYSSM